MLLLDGKKEEEERKNDGKYTVETIKRAVDLCAHVSSNVLNTSTTLALSE